MDENIFYTNFFIVSNLVQSFLVFHYAQSFNRGLDWDTRAVTDMNRMFKNAHNFNGDVSKFKTERVVDMNYMFASARKFNADLSKWQTGAATDMTGMFHHAESFNGDISKWITGVVTSMRSSK